MRIHRFIDPKQRDAAKRGANRSCKALNLSLDTINLRRFAHIESWDKAGKHVIAQTGSDRYLEQNVPNAIP